MTLVSLTEMFKEIIYMVALNCASIKDLWVSNDDILCVPIATSCQQWSVLSLLLERDEFVSLNLIRLESQFQKPQKQSRKLFFRFLFLLNQSQYLRILQRNRTNRTYISYFKELAHTVVGAAMSKIHRTGLQNGNSWYRIASSSGNRFCFYDLELIGWGTFSRVISFT